MRPEMQELAKKVFKFKEGKKESKYAACFLEYFPKACDADQETREGCVSILDEHFVDVNGIHSKMFEYRNAKLVVLKMQGYGNKVGNDGEFFYQTHFVYAFQCIELHEGGRFRWQ